MNHKQRLLEYLIEYKSITSLEAIRELGNTRLSAYIYQLKKEGYIINTTTVKVKNRFNEYTHVAKYCYTGIDVLK